jgi:general secretion pathway protein F
VLESLRIAGEVVSNIPMRNSVQSAAVRVREGAPIGKSLAAGGLFPPMTIHLINSGEASGQLETMLERAAANQEREIIRCHRDCLAVMEPMRASSSWAPSCSSSSSQSSCPSSRSTRWIK